MAAHNDPGVLTLTLASQVPGLEVLDRARGPGGVWMPLEALMAPDEVMVFAGEQLEAATSGRVRACLHRVDVRPQAAGSRSGPTEEDGDAAPAVAVAPPLGRNSVVFELRAPGC